METRPGGSVRSMTPLPIHVLSRFGLGRGLGEPLPDDPRQWAADQLAGPGPVAPGATVADAFAAVAMDRADKRDNPDSKPDRAHAIFTAERAALLDGLLTTALPFRERLVAFWANHFTVSIRRGEVGPLLGDYVRTAIRPNVHGRFGDMLLAVMRHPAMLLYLDNAASAGPNSIAAGRGKRGINENLARESLELHTVSPLAGYTQADVTAYASVLAGWSVEQTREPVGFRFNPAFAEPGGKTVMGRPVAEGEAGGVEFLAWLANHPLTHRHLATKLVRHFVADDPPPNAVRRLEGVRRDTATSARRRSRSWRWTRRRRRWQSCARRRTTWSRPCGRRCCRAACRRRSGRTFPASWPGWGSRRSTPRSPSAGPTRRRSGPARRRCCAASTGPTATPAGPRCPSPRGWRAPPTAPSTPPPPGTTKPRPAPGATP